MKLANKMLLYAKLAKFYYYATKYTQRMHNNIPVKYLCYEMGYQEESLSLHFQNPNLNIKHFTMFWYSVLFKKYDMCGSGQSTRSKYTQQKNEAFLLTFLMTLQNVHLSFMMPKELIFQHILVLMKITHHHCVHLPDHFLMYN